DLDLAPHVRSRRVLLSRDEPLEDIGVHPDGRVGGAVGRTLCDDDTPGVDPDVPVSLALDLEAVRVVEAVEVRPLGALLQTLEECPRDHGGLTLAAIRRPPTRAGGVRSGGAKGGPARRPADGGSARARTGSPRLHAIPGARPPYGRSRQRHSRRCG